MCHWENIGISCRVSGIQGKREREREQKLEKFAMTVEMDHGSGHAGEVHFWWSEAASVTSCYLAAVSHIIMIMCGIVATDGFLAAKGEREQATLVVQQTD